MLLRNLYTGKKEIVHISAADAADLKLIAKSGGFQFNWNKAKGKAIYKLHVRPGGEIIGLIALDDIPRELRIDVLMLEASLKNVGSLKTYDGIAGCLIAHACQLAFLNGYGGFVSLTPKTVLKKHYMEAYGFVEMGRKLCTFDRNSAALIDRYLKLYEDEEIYG